MFFSSRNYQIDLYIFFDPYIYFIGTFLNRANCHHVFQKKFSLAPALH